MAFVKPASSDPLNSPSHSLLHRIFVADSAAPEDSVQVGSAGQVLLVNYQQITKAALGATTADGLILQNLTAAISGTQQVSPALHFTGQGWKTTATAASQSVDFRTYVTPVQGSSAPTGYLGWESAINGGAYTNRMALTNAGLLGIGTTTPNANLEVVGASALPDTSGSAAFGGMRFGNPGAGVAFDFGFYGSIPVAWLQARNSTTYASNFQIMLNPNGGGVSIGAGSLGYNGALTLPTAPAASANYGILSLGSGGNWKGGGTAPFVGSASGTIYAANEVSGYAGNLIDLQVAGVSKFKVDATGIVTPAGNLVLGANSITLTGSIAATGSRVTKGWFTDIEVTNAPTVGGVALPTPTSTTTLSSKRITPRVTTITSSGTPTINTDNCDAVTITAQAAAITSMTTNLTGTPTNFDKLIFRIKDDGTARAITWGSSFEAKGTALPTTTVISKVLTVGFIYDTVTSKWGCVASAQEA